MSKLGILDRLRMSLRLCLLQATWNYERQQGLGWAWAIEPALRRFYGDANERRKRLAEHTAYFNTQPTMCSLALGAVARLESERARTGVPDSEAIARVKNVLGASLAALGDRTFWFTLRPLAACLGVLFALRPSPLGAAVLLVSYNVIHLGVRWLGTGWGFERGPAVLDAERRADFERLVAWWGALGAGIIGLLVAAQLEPAARGGMRPALGFLVGLATGLAVAGRARPTPTEMALAIAGLALAMTWRS
jgi:PTS system mannose-specific IID component